MEEKKTEAISKPKGKKLLLIIGIAAFVGLILCAVSVFAVFAYIQSQIIYEPAPNPADPGNSTGEENPESPSNLPVKEEKLLFLAKTPIGEKQLTAFVYDIENAKTLKKKVITTQDDGIRDSHFGSPTKYNPETDDIYFATFKNTSVLEPGEDGPTACFAGLTADGCRITISKANFNTDKVEKIFSQDKQFAWRFDSKFKYAVLFEEEENKIIFSKLDLKTLKKSEIVSMNVSEKFNVANGSDFEGYVISKDSKSILTVMSKYNPDVFHQQLILRTIDIETGKFSDVVIPEFSSNSILSSYFSADQKKIAFSYGVASTETYAFGVYDIDSNKFDNVEGPDVHNLTVVWAGGRFYWQSNDNNLIYYDLSSKKIVKDSVDLKGDKDVIALTGSPSGKYLLIVRTPGDVTSLNNQKVELYLPATKEVKDLGEEFENTNRDNGVTGYEWL